MNETNESITLGGTSSAKAPETTNNAHQQAEYVKSLSENSGIPSELPNVPE